MTISQTVPRIPLVILGGRDRRGSELPDGTQDRHALQGYKGVVLKVGGRPLIQVLIDRLRAVEVFSPIYIAGPRHVYQDFLTDNVRLIETDGSFGANLRACVEATRVDGEYSEQLGFVTCDILPDPVELRHAVDDLIEHSPVDFWMPQIRVPDEETSLGTSDWKPRYRLAPPGSGTAVPVLPGHLLVAAPSVLRMEFALQFLDQLYETRNRSLAYRRAALTKALLGSLLAQDLRLLMRLKPPINLFDVVFWSLFAVARLMSGRATTTQMARYIRRVFVVRSQRRRHGDRRGRVPLLDALSLARDIDTLEEAREVAGEVALMEAESVS
ncbi:MAG: hypothetical protein MPN21_19995 [Thermoanaerobaculia bacterium]|nr:hypothetical protein [Thermoanaerobaculia bacterium]